MDTQRRIFEFINSKGEIEKDVYATKLLTLIMDSKLNIACMRVIHSRENFETSILTERYLSFFSQSKFASTPK